MNSQIFLTEQDRIVGLTRLFSCLVVLFIVLQMIEGCTNVVADPWVVTEVSQENEQVNVRFFIRKVSWWSTRITKVPYEIHTLAVGDFKSVTWEIRSREGTHGVKEITYGVIPEGFEQVIPKVGGPPSLKKGNEYEVMARGAGGSVTKFIVN